MKSSVYILVLLFFLLAGCGLDGIQGAAPPAFGYYALFTQSHHVSKLLEDNKIEDASEVYNREEEFFKKIPKEQSGKEQSKVLSALAQKLNERFETRLENTLDSLKKIIWPGLPQNWESIKNAIASSRGISQEYYSHLILREPKYRLPLVDDIDIENTKWAGRFKNDVKKIFSRYEIGKWQEFFSIYPIKIDAGNFIETNWEDITSRLDEMTYSELKHVFSNYKPYLSPVQKEYIALNYFKAYMREKGSEKRHAFEDIVDGIIKTKAAELPLRNIPSSKIALIEITSPTLLKEGGVEFPVSVKIDLPIKTEKAPLEKAFERPIATKADILIVLDVAIAKVFRNIRNKKQVGSEYKSGTRKEANPAYQEASLLVQKTTLELQNANLQSAATNAQYCQGYGCLGKAFSQIVDAALVAAKREAYDAARQQLLSTPSTIDIDVYSPYYFNRATIKSAKSMTVFYYVIDRVQKKYFKSSFDAQENQSFVVLYNLKDTDRNLWKHQGNSNKEKDVSDFEKKALSVNLSSIINDYFQKKDQKKDLPDENQLRADFLKTRNRSVKAFLAKHYETKPVNDNRFESVVLVRNPKGGIGSGFFVKDDVVLTNYHVIQGARFVEMKMFNKHEIFGKLIAKDIRLDLALIKVQARGKPVKLFSKRSLPLGGTVDAIGHPRGLEFSIARGVISGIRDIKSKYAPSGKPIKFIQTDTAINPGNSGGPLFLRDTVVGVNTQKLAATELEGLGFAVHYGEVLEFLRRNQILIRNQENEN